MGKLQNLPEFYELFESAIAGFSTYIEQKHRISAPAINRVILTLLGNDALYDPTYMASLLQFCSFFNSIFTEDLFMDNEWFENADFHLMKTTV